jgi:hypothetical protein
MNEEIFSEDTFDIPDADIDAGWSDESADQPDESEESAEVTEASEEKEVEDAPTEEKSADQRIFTLKHLDEVKEVSEEEIVKLAQQGMDYERIRTDRDALKTFKTENEGTLALFTAFAKESGMSLQQYGDFLREQSLIQTGLSPEAAKERVQLDNDKATLEVERKAVEQERTTAQAQQRADQLKQERISADLQTFLSTYPDVKPSDIPKDVWAVVHGEGGKAPVPLVTAYTKHLNDQMKMELEALKQDKENRAKSPGSMNTKGAKSDIDALIDSIWDSD